MVRTKSARHKGDSSRVDTHLDDSSDNSEFSEEEFSDKDSDYGNAGKKGKKDKAPPAKKAKKGSAKRSSAKNASQTESLSLLPAMPVDVLFEIFSHLGPNDIIQLSRTNRVLRDILMTRSATFVWKAARERFEAPECPTNMSEPQWAALLFGDICESCGAKNVPKPEFSLLRRVCTTCKKVNYLIETNFETRFPNCDPEILELIPHTNASAWSGGYSARNRYFWMPDIYAMLPKLEEYQDNILSRRPNAKRALTDFETQQTELLDSILESKSEREQWYTHFSSQREASKKSPNDQRFESIRSKFLELGYATDDVDCVRRDQECQQRAPLTDRIWKRIRPILEPKVLLKKQERIEEEMKPIRSTRRTIVHASYQEYKKTLVPSQWKYLPRTLDICGLDPFAKVIDAKADLTVTAADFEDAFHQLPELLAASSDALKSHARSLIQNSMRTNQSASTAPGPGQVVEGEAASSSQPDALDLATAVFTCQESSCGERYLFGWDDIAQHHCRMDLDQLSSRRSYLELYNPFDCAPRRLRISFDSLTSKVAAVVVRAAGLDDKVATVSDMDAKDLRLGCSVCSPMWRFGRRKVGYKWRDFVLHSMTYGSKQHAPEVLPPETIAMVKSSEMSDPKRSKSHWTCGRCTVHLGDLKLRESVVEHLESAHEINSPREPEDLFLIAPNTGREKFEATYPVEP